MAADGGRRDDPPGPPLPGQLDGERPDAARGGVHDDGLAGGQVGAAAQQVPRGGPLQDQGQRDVVRDVVGQREDGAAVGEGLFGVAAPGQGQRDHPTAVEVAAADPSDDLAARDQRELLPGKVGVLGLMGVREVHPGRA